MKLVEPDHPELDTDTEPTLHEVAPDVFAVVQLDGSWGLSNAMLVRRPGSSVLVDTFFTERRNRRLREIITAVDPAQPRFLVNTHHHGDHVHGNGFFPEALIVTHEATRAALAVLDPSVSARRFSNVDFGVTCPSMPDLTFSERLTLTGEGLEVTVIHPGLAHCPGNSVVFVPERGVLAAGDLLLSGCTPTFVGGSALGFRSVLADLRELAPKVVVTGHGPVCGPEVFAETEAYLDLIVDLAEKGLANSATPLQVARDTDLGQFARWHDRERIVGNLYRAMSELSGAEGIDVKKMWADTHDYLGHAVRSRA